MSRSVCRMENETDIRCDASPRSSDQLSNVGPRPADATIGWRSGMRFVVARLLGFARPATKQIFARPADPLSVALSYEILRNGIGVLALALPIVLIVGGGTDEIQASLSAYYHFSGTEPARYGAGTMRDAFVGMLCAIGAFLFFYRGHSLQEDLALNCAGISVVLVAFMPMDWPPASARPASVTGTVHWISATIFFVMIGYVCIFRARDTLCLTSDRKRRRAFERIYLIFGALMLATPAAVAASLRQSGYATLIVEICGIVVFSCFWLIKGYEIRSSLRGPLP